MAEFALKLKSDGNFVIARNYSGRGIKISKIWGVDRELVRVRNKWVLREEAPNTYPPKE